MQYIEYTRVHPKWGEFKDALTMPEDATPAQIEAEQDARLQAFVDRLENPPPPPPPPDEEQ